METINIFDIVIPEDFSNHKPKDKKISKVRRYVEEYGCLDKPIVLNDNNILVDNYIRYLIALENGFKEVPYITTQEYIKKSIQEELPMNYITGKFQNSKKEYTWKNKNNISIKVGDRVLVKTKSPTGKNRGVVTVVNVFASSDQKLLRHKPVIKNLRISVVKEK